MELMMKAAVIGVTGTLVALVLKKTNPEISLLLAVGISVAVLGLVLQLVSGLVEIVDLAARASGLSGAILSPVLKCVGIGILARIAADICKDAGQGSIASSVEVAGSVCALYSALPLIKTLLRMIGEMT